MSRTKLQKLLAVALKILITGVIFYFLVHAIEPDKMLQYLKKTNILLFVVSGLVSFVSFCISGIRSRYYLSQFAIYITKLASIYLYYIGLLFNIILPGGVSGDIYKMHFLKKQSSLKYKNSLKVFFYERLNGLYALLFLAIIIFIFSDFYKINQYVAYLAQFSMIAITPCYLFFTSGLFGDQIKCMIRASFFSFAIQSLQIISCIFLVYALDPQIELKSLLNYLVVFVVASVAVIIPISIGGAGLRELTFLQSSSLLPTINAEFATSLGFLIFLQHLVISLLGAPIYLFCKNKIKAEIST